MTHTTTTARQTATITVTEDVRTDANVLYAGTYVVEMPADYDPALVTGQDILLDDAIRVTGTTAHDTPR